MGSTSRPCWAVRRADPSPTARRRCEPPLRRDRERECSGKTGFASARRAAVNRRRRSRLGTALKCRRSASGCVRTKHRGGHPDSGGLASAAIALFMSARTRRLATLSDVSGPESDNARSQISKVTPILRRNARMPKSSLRTEGANALNPILGRPQGKRFGGARIAKVPHMLLSDD